MLTATITHCHCLLSETQLNSPESVPLAVPLLGRCGQPHCLKPMERLKPTGGTSVSLSCGGKTAMKEKPARENNRGICCPGCGCAMMYVVYTRQRANHVFRLRECRYCGRRVTTRERMQEVGFEQGCDRADPVNSGTARPKTNP